MELILAGLATVAVLAGSGQVAQIFLTRRIKKLVLEGSRFHLASLPSGSVELRSGVRQGSMTQKEAANLATGLRILTEKVRWNPIFGLKLLLGNHADANGRSIEDSFSQLAIESQQRELIMLSEDRGVTGAVPLIRALSSDEDFEKLRNILSTAEMGELPVSVLRNLKTVARPTDLEPLVLWSSQGAKPLAVGSAPQQKAITPAALPKGHIADGEIPGMPGYQIRTYLKNRGESYAKVVVAVNRGMSTVASEFFYLNNYQNEIESKTQSLKRALIKQVKDLNAMGVG